MRVFVCDTSSLVHSPNALHSFGNNLIVIPMAALEEMDNIKQRRNDVASVNARNIIRTIDKLQEEQQSDTVVLDNGARIIPGEMTPYKLDSSFDQSKADNQILSVAMHYKEEYGDVALVSNDASMRTKARKLGLKAIGLEDDRINVRVDGIYPGWIEYPITPERIERFYNEGAIKTRKEFLPNEFVLLQNQINPKQTGLGRYNHITKEIEQLKHHGAKAWDIGAKNLQQHFAMDLLLDRSIEVVSIVGQAGTGKTLLALAAGGEQVDRGIYDKMVVYKPLIPVGEDVGFLPGELEDKIGPYMGSIYDNLEFILGKPTNPKDKNNDKIEYYISSGKLELAALTFIRGRSLPRIYIVVDEAQNLTPQQVKTIATRLGEGSKVVFVGDPYQIDHPYLDYQSNGLTYLTERLKNEPEVGSITLSKPERSSIAEKCAQLL